MCCLLVLDIYIDPSSSISSSNTRDFDILSVLIRSLRVSLTSPATLEHLKLNFEFKGSVSMRYDLDYFF